MGFEYLIDLFPKVVGIYFLLQVVILVGDSKKKYGYIVNAFGIGILCTNLIIFLFGFSIIEVWFLFFIVIITGIIQLILSLISFFYYKVYKGTIKLERFLIAFMTTIIINIIALVIVPGIVQNIENNNKVNKIEEALIMAHGDLGFKVVDFGYETSDNGIISTSITGRWYKVKYGNTDEYFIVSTNDDNLLIQEDDFLPLYYSIELGLKYESFCDSSSGPYGDYNKYYDYIESKIEDKYNVEASGYNMDYSNYGILNTDQKINSIDEIVDEIQKSNNKELN